MKEFQCEKLFNTKNYLKKHYNRIHNNSGKVSTCNVCTKSFPSKQDLTIHIKTCHRGKHYKCDSCIKSFFKAGLKKHIHTVHEGNKDYKCEYCGKNLSSRQILKKHIHIIHEGQKRPSSNVNLAANHFLE